MAVLLAAFTFLSISVMAGIIYYATSNDRAGMFDRLLRRPKPTGSPAGTKVLVGNKLLIRDESLSTVPVLNRMLLRWSGAVRYSRFLTQAGLKVKPAKVLLVSAVIGVSTFLVISSAFNSELFPLVLAACAAALPTFVVSIKRTKRLRAFEGNFPEAIDLLGRAIRAGHAFTTGLEMISKELPEPVSGEFRTTFEEQNFGLPLREALENLAIRVPLVDMKFFVAALLIQKETGGNLAELLDNLSKVIRDRFRIMGEVRVRTAQGRLTAALLIALPPSLLVILSVLNHDYVQVLFNDPLGITMLGFAGMMQLLGSLWIWKVVQVQI